MQRDKRKIESALKTKGFFIKEGDHHYFRYFTKNGKKTAIYTKTSHGIGSKTIHDPLLSPMAKQCKITKTQFIELIDCPLNREDYETILRRQSLI